ncbi:MAG: hypothetical protein ACD_26C00033G0001 [uncultured bacterium]|nr:MAG: hypothetical protein ACD_26C00033G0001 [uncultured bacterium]
MILIMFIADELRLKKEDQTFDRKSIRIEPKALAMSITAFANADGGTIAIGITDDGQIEGINGYTQKINEILRVPFDFCKPTVKVDFEYVDCVDRDGNPNKIFLLNVFQSKTVHSNQGDDVFYRVGDKSKKLTFDERLQLMYDKGDMLYENTFIKGTKIEDLDMILVNRKRLM